MRKALTLLVFYAVALSAGATIVLLHEEVRDPQYLIRMN